MFGAIATGGVGGQSRRRSGILRYMESAAEANSRLLRESDDPFWVRLRELLAEKGIDWRQAAIAQCFPDDAAMEFGIVVAADGEVYEFDFLHGRGDIATAMKSGVLSDWTRTTDRWRDRPFREDVNAAFALLGTRP